MRKAANGEGSIRKHHDGRWEARYTAMVGGAWKRQSIMGRTREDVAKQLRVALQARDAGQAPAASAKLTLGRFLDDWMAGIEPTLKPRTAIAYRQVIRDHLQPALGTTPLARLRPEQLQRLYADMLARGKSPKTISNVAGVLHAALKQAQQWRLVSANIASLVSPPRRQRPEMHVLDAAEVRAILEAAGTASDPLAALWALALGTGMRAGEMLALRWSDIDLKRGLISVRHSLVVNSSELADPKTDASRRIIHLSGALIDRLARHKADAQPALFVFHRSDGRPLSHAMVLKAWHRALKRAGLPKLRFHDARHSVATTLLARTGNARMVADVLGHADVATTLRMYAHTTPSQHEQAAAILGEAL